MSGISRKETSYATRERSTRNRDKPPTIYSSKYHPMDEQLRPAQVRKMKAELYAVEVDVNNAHTNTAREGDRSVSGDSSHHSTEAEGEYSSEAPIKASRRQNASSSTQLESEGCRRSSRNPNQVVPNYNMNYHPGFDPVMRPNAPATLAAKAASKGFSKTAVNDHDDQRNAASDSNQKASEVGTKLSFSPIMCISFPELPNDACPKPVTSHKRVERGPQVRIPAFSSNHTDKMSHPFPKNVPQGQSDKAVNRSSTGTESLSSPESPTEPTPTLIHRSDSLEPSTLQNPNQYQRVIDPDCLGRIDEVIYYAMKGAPTKGDTLPMTWAQVKHLLVQGGEIARDEYNSIEALNQLEERYESCRVGIEAFFESKPEPSEKVDWPLFYVEDFEVFNKKSGSRYWKHQRDSTVRPYSNKSSHVKLAEIADSEDEYSSDSITGEVAFSERISTAGRAEKSATVPLLRDYSFYSKVTAPSENGDLFLSATQDSADIGGEQSLVETMQKIGPPSSDGLMGDEELGELLSPRGAIGTFFADLENYLDPITESLPRRSLREHSSTGSSGSYPQISLNQSSSPPKSSGHYTTTSLDHPDLTEASPQRSPHQPSQPSKASLPESTPRKKRPQPLEQESKEDEVPRKKRRSKDETTNSVAVFEDLPASTPRARRAMAKNPISPGTDFPKENIGVERMVQHPSEIESRTPRHRRLRPRSNIGTPIRSRPLLI